MENSQLGGVRRVHIVYFLCRNGMAEPPHLIRVHHLHRNGGVRLRDVKRWLSELRGKDMPESFAWSYKRRYKEEHVWQDLTDDDLITSISDNEYVLKGSELPHKHSTPLFGTAETVSTGEKTPGHIKATAAVEETKLEVLSLISPTETLQSDQDDNISPKLHLRLDHGWPETPTISPPTFDLESPRYPPPLDSNTTNKSSSKPKNIVEINKWMQDEKEPEGGEGRAWATSFGVRSRNNHVFHSSGSTRRSSNIFRSIRWCRAEGSDGYSVPFPIQGRESGWSGSGAVECSRRRSFDAGSLRSKIKSSCSSRKCEKAFKQDNFYLHMKSSKAPLKGSMREHIDMHDDDKANTM